MATARSKTLKRLWMVATALVTLVATLAVGNFALPEEKRLTAKTLGHDFLAFYTAGAFVREGRTGDLYDLEQVKAFQHELAKREGLQIGTSFGPYWNPPFYAWVFEPLAGMTFLNALHVWWLINAAALGVGVWGMVRMLRGSGGSAGHGEVERGCVKDSGVKHEDMKHEEGGRGMTGIPSGLQLSTSKFPSSLRRSVASSLSPHIYLLLPLLLLTSMPLVQAFSHGQNTFVSLAILVGTVGLWRGGRAVLAGMVAGLLMYKPQLGMVVAGALVFSMGWRALAGLAITGVALAAVTVFTLPGTLGDYQRLMPPNLHQFQVVQTYMWERHATLRAFWRLLLQGHTPGEMIGVAKVLWLASCGVVGWFLLRAGLAARRSSSPAVRDGFIASVIIAMPIVMPFYFDYDLLLVSVAGMLCARVCRTGEAEMGRPARGVFWAWVGLYAWLMVNPSIARLTHFNGTVVMLAACFAATVRLTLWAARRGKTVDDEAGATPDVLATAA